MLGWEGVVMGFDGGEVQIQNREKGGDGILQNTAYGGDDKGDKNHLPP